MGLAVVPLANLLVAGLAVLLGPENRPNQLFRETELITWLNSVELFTAGLLACVLWELSPTPAERRNNRFWLLAGLFLVYLSADEFLQYHDRFGMWLAQHVVPRPPPPIRSVDNVILILYAAFASALVIVHRRRLLASPMSLGLLLIAGALAAGSLLVDVLTLGFFLEKAGTMAYRWSEAGEESLKFVASGFIAAAVLSDLVRCISSGMVSRLDPPMRFSIMPSLLVLNVGIMVFALAQYDLTALLGSHNLLSWFSSLERAAAGVFAVMIAASAAQRRTSGMPATIWWFLIAFALAASGAEIYFAQELELSMQSHIPERTVATSLHVAFLMAAAVLIMLGWRLLRRSSSEAGPPLLLCVVFGLSSVGLEAISSLPGTQHMAATLDLAAICTGSLASLWVLWWMYGCYRQIFRNSLSPDQRQTAVVAKMR
jgi:hypothetical protein